jgi:hypothetical protein
MNKNVFFTFFTIILLSIGGYYYYKVSTKIIILYKQEEIKTKLIGHNPYLALDKSLGWVNAKNSSSVFPKDDLNLKFKNDTRKNYTIGKDGERVLEKKMIKVDNPKMEIWVIGDSSPFGFGVKMENTFSYLLGRKLNNQSIFVKNFAVVGYTTFQIVKLLKFNLNKLSNQRPHKIIFWGGFNNISFSRDWFTKKPVKERELSKEIEKLRSSIYELMSLCEKMNIKLIVSTIPSHEKTIPITKVNQFYRTLKRVTLLDTEKLFNKYGNSIELYNEIDTIFPFYFHPSAKGHKIVAKKLIHILNNKN